MNRQEIQIRAARLGRLRQEWEGELKPFLGKFVVQLPEVRATERALGLAEDDEYRQELIAEVKRDYAAARTFWVKELDAFLQETVLFMQPVGGSGLK